MALVLVLAAVAALSVLFFSVLLVVVPVMALVLWVRGLGKPAAPPPAQPPDGSDRVIDAEYEIRE